MWLLRGRKASRSSDNVIGLRKPELELRNNKAARILRTKITERVKIQRTELDSATVFPCSIFHV